ncbi:aromatic-ring hydroxylase C-terminal domain-containing protein [Streptomyces sp. CAS3]
MVRPDGYAAWASDATPAPGALRSALTAHLGPAPARQLL